MASSVDTSRARAKLFDAGKQARFAMASALTATAKDAERAVEARLPRVFDRPVSFTLRGIAIIPARRDHLESVVLVKDRQAEYLAIQEVGGVRVPTPGAPVVLPVQIRTNVYGNIPRGAIRREIAKPNTFVAASDDPRTRDLPPGVYRRYARRRGGRAARPPRLLVAFKRRARYAPRFGFRQTVIAVARQVFPRRFTEALRRTLATAR